LGENENGIVMFSQFQRQHSLNIEVVAHTTSIPRFANKWHRLAIRIALHNLSSRE
jgi:hypothetical protein